MLLVKTMNCIVILCISMLSSSIALNCPAVENPVQLPSVDPVQFSYQVQISIEDTRQTLNANEFYDFENGTVTLYVDQSYGSNYTAKDTKISYDYKYNQTFIVERTNGSSTCTVQDLNVTLPHQPTLFGVGVENGPLGVTNAFYWNSTANSTFVGPDVIDGIETNHYNTCLSFQNGSLLYFVDVYFSVANWSMPAGQNAPVFLKLNATSENKSSIYNYKFSAYHDSQSPINWRPQKPGDMICHGRKDAPVFPPGNYSRYSLVSQARGTAANGFNFLFDFEFFEDYDKGLLLMNAKSFRNVQRLLDFHQGLMYSTNGTTGSCEVSTIPLRSNQAFIVVLNNTQVKLRTFDPRRELNLTYGGQTFYRGILCHSWISQQALTAYDPIDRVANASTYFTYYFTVDRYNGNSSLVGMKETIVAKINSSTVTHVLHVDVLSEKFDFDPLVFDISRCFNESMRRTVILKFSDEHQNEVQMYPKAFQRAIVAAVAKHSGLEEIRVKFTGSFQAANDSSKNSHDTGGIYVWITLLGVPNVTGDSADMIPQVDLTTGAASLKNVVNANSFVITFPGPQGSTMAAFPDYFETEDDLLQPHRPPPAPATSSGISKGAAAGIGIGMVVLGFLLGCGVFHYRNGKLRSQYAYSMQS